MKLVVDGPIMDHMRIHHLNEYNVVVVVNDKGQSLTSFTGQWKEPRVIVLFGNGSVRENVDQNPPTPNVTPNTGDDAGVTAKKEDNVEWTTCCTLYMHHIWGLFGKEA